MLANGGRVQESHHLTSAALCDLIYHSTLFGKLLRKRGMASRTKALLLHLLASLVLLNACCWRAAAEGDAPDDPGLTREELKAEFQGMHVATVVVLCIEDVFWELNPLTMETVAENMNLLLDERSTAPVYHSTRASTCERVRTELNAPCYVVDYAKTFTIDPRTERIWTERFWVADVALDAGKNVLMMDADVRLTRPLRHLVEMMEEANVDMVVQATFRQPEPNLLSLDGLCAGLYYMRASEKMRKAMEMAHEEMKLVRTDPFAIPEEFRKIIPSTKSKRLKDATGFDQDVMLDVLHSMLEAERVKPRKEWSARRVANEAMPGSFPDALSMERNDESRMVHGATCEDFKKEEWEMQFDQGEGHVSPQLCVSADGEYRILASGVHGPFVSWPDFYESAVGVEKACQRYSNRFFAVHCHGDPKPEQCVTLHRRCRDIFREKREEVLKSLSYHKPKPKPRSSFSPRQRAWSWKNSAALRQQRRRRRRPRSMLSGRTGVGADSTESSEGRADV